MNILIKEYDKKSSGIEKPFIQFFLIGILVLICIFLSFTSPYFLTWNNFRNIFDHTSLQLIMAIGMTFVISSKGIDLSIGSIVALVGICIGLLLKAGVSVVIASLAGVLIGGLLGVFNGVIISKFKIAPFIVTIGSQSLFRGISLIITEGKPIYGFPINFTYFGKGNLGQINFPIILGILLVVVSGLLLKYTKWGQYTLALGGNEEALRRVGVSINFYKTTIYMFSGLMAGIAGLIYTSRLNAAEPNAGFMLESDIIAAVILGGTPMKGGKASIGGTVIACFLLGVVRNALTLLSISSYYQQLFIGGIIILSASISEIRQRKQVKIS